MKILSNPLVLGAIALGIGYIALKAGVFDSILGKGLGQEFANDPARLARIKRNPEIREGIKGYF